MATENTQTVVDAAKDRATPAAAATDARKTDDLDALLAEFSAGTAQPAKTVTKPDTQTTTAATTAPDKRLDAIEERLRTEQMQRDLAPVVSKIKAAMPAEILDDAEVEDWLEGRARRDPRLAQAWQNRHQNPEAWGKVVDALGQQMAKKFAKVPDKGATEDRAAVTAAVRGASTVAPVGKAPDYSRMSPREFGDAVEKEHGYRPQGT